MQTLYDIRFENGFLAEERRSLRRLVFITVASAVIAVCAVAGAYAVGESIAPTSEVAAAALS